MRKSQAPETYPVAGPNWQGTLKVWRGDDGKARQLTVLLPDGAEIPVTRDQIEDGDESFMLPLTEAELRGGRQEQVVVPVVAEQAFVGKEQIATEGVKVRKHVHERTEQVEMPLTREDIDVQRIAVNQVVDSVPQVRDDGELMVIPVVHEEMIVSKRLVLKEEIHIRRIRSTERTVQPVTTRSESAEVLHTDASGNPVSTERLADRGREPARSGRKYRFLKDW